MGTFRQCIELPRAVAFLLDEMTDMTAQMYKCIATIGWRNVSSRQPSAHLPPTSIILPTCYDVEAQGPVINKWVGDGTGDQYPRPWLKRLERMVKLGLFLSPAEWRASVEDDDVFFQAYGAVVSQFGPSSFLQTC